MEDVNKKPKRAGPSKKLIFEKEQKEILNNIYKIMEITNENKMIAFYDIENDEKKSEAIIALVDDIKKYFKAMPPYDPKKRKEISLIKHVLKHLNIKYTTSTKYIYRNKETHKTTAIILIG